MPKEVYRNFKITNETKNLSIVRTAISDILKESTLATDERNKVILAIDEAVSNVIEHAYENETGMIDIELDLNAERLQVKIRDNGRKFDPNAVADPNIIEHIKVGKKKGLGMYLMRKIMDEVRYSLDSSFENELVMVKFVD